MTAIKVLLVEAEPIDALDIKQVLESFNYKVLYITSYGEEAIKKAQELLPDIVLMDIILKGKISGLEAASEIKKMGIPIIYLTVHSEEATIHKAKFTEPYGYLVKPFELMNLKNSIELALFKHEVEQKLKGIIQGSPIPQFVLDKNHRVMYWNNALEKYSDIKAEDVIGTTDHWKAFYNTKRPCLADLLLDNTVKTVSHHQKDKFKKSELLDEAYESTDFFPKIGETGKWLYFTATTIKNSKGEVIGAIETLEDITRRKNAEMELISSETQYRTILENVQDAYIRSDENGQIIMASPSAARMYRYNSPQDMIGISAESLYKNPEDRILMLEKLKKQDILGDFEAKGMRNDGTSFWASVNAECYHDDQGQIQGLDGFIRDISERKNSEEILRQSEERFRALICNSTDIIRILDEKGIIVFDSPSSERILGYPKDFFPGKNPLDFIHPDDRKRVFADLGEVYQNRNPGTPTEFRIMKADGEYLPVETVSRNMMDVPGIEGIVVTTHPIRERKIMEEALRTSEEKYRTLFESDPNYTILVGLDGVILDVNNAAVNFAGSSKEKLIGEKFTELGLFLEEEIDLQLKNFTRTIQTRMIQAFQCRVFNKGGGISWIESRLVPLEKEGVLHSILVIATNVTDKKIATDNLESSLKEKEVLIKEIHHRVKNNMQIISSLLNLQTQHVDDDQLAMDVLKESQNRVRSMAMIHEKLYQSNDFTNIKFDDYIERLISELFYSYNINQDQIKPVLNVEDVLLNIETGIPCGLIISELVSNSLKHAFPQGREGELQISLQTYDNKYELIISDDGVGFPEDLDYRNTESLGLQLVNSLVNQVNGELELHQSNGTKFKITFKALEYSERV
jgi:PAS domain S-box-containing protein